MTFDPVRALLKCCPVDWRRVRLEVYAWPPYGSWRPERGTIFFKRAPSILTSRSTTKANILISNDRRACIADFGLTTITGVISRAAAGTSKTSLISTDTLMSFTAGGTYRWMSPELLHPERFGISESEDNRPTGHSDCYALGMVIYEVGVCEQVRCRNG